MKNLTLKKCIVCAIILVIGVFTLAGPAFALAETWGITLTGYDLLERVADISGSSAEYDLAIAAAFIMMFVGIAGIVLATLSCFLLGDRKRKIACNTTLVFSMISAVLYTVAGGLIGEDTTVAFVPLILIVVFLIAYVVCIKVLPEKALNPQGEITASTHGKFCAGGSRTAAEEMIVIELLTKYKKLLDDGVITQEEFEKKKSQWL